MKNVKLRQLAKYLFFFLVSGVISIFAYNRFYSNHEIQKQVRYVALTENPQSFSCESALYSDIIGTVDGFGDYKRGIYGRVLDGTDKLSIEMKEDKAKFLTQAGLEIGNAEGADMTILENSEDNLVLYSSSSGVIIDNTHEIVIINKKNGMGVWTKTRKAFFTNDSPDASIIYLTCSGI